MISRNVIITGATSGVGKALALRVAQRKAKLIMFCRDKTKAESTRNELIQKSHNEDIHIIIADLSSMESVKEAAARIKRTFPELYMLVNNAGCSVIKRTITEEGIEKTFASNYLGHYVLTMLLVDFMKVSAPSRIINVASQAHTKIDFDNLSGEKKYNYFTAYKYSKAANILFTFDLAEKLKDTGISVNCVHPGVVRSNIYDNIKGINKLLIKSIWPFFITPEKSADMIMPLLLSKDFRNITGKYFVKGKAVSPKKDVDNVSDRMKLRELSEKLTQIKL